MTFPLINACASIVRLPDPSPADAPAAVALVKPEPALLAPRIFYTPEKYGALEEFLLSPDFKIFEEQLQSGIHDLIQFVRDQTPGEEAEKEQATLNLTEDLAYFSKNLLVEDSLDTETREINEMSGLALHRKQEAYGEGKQALDQMLTDIADKAQPESQLADAIGDLASSLLLSLHVDSRISYDVKIYGPLTRFLAHPHFTIFEAQFRSGMDGLIQLLRDDAVSGKEEKDKAVRKFEESANFFLDSIFSDRTKPQSRLVGYEDGKKALDRLSRLIADGKLPKPDLVDAIKCLTPDLMVCTDGATKHLTDTTNRLQQMLGGENWGPFVQAKAGEHISAFLRDGYQISNIHMVSGLINRLATKFGLTKQNDSYAETSGITDEIADACSRYLAANMTQAGLVLAYADEYLSKITSVMNKNFVDGNSAADFTRVPYMEKLEHAMKELEPIYGVFDLDCVIKPLDEEFSRFCLLTDASLIAKRFLETKIADENAFYKKAEECEVTPTALGIHSWGKDIFWADADGDSQPVTISHLQQLAPRQCAKELVAFIDQIVRNSEPDELLEHFSWAWLCKTDPAILAARLGKDDFSTFIDQHGKAIKNLPDDKLKQYCKVILTHVKPATLEEFGKDLYKAFPSPQVWVKTLENFRETARKHNDLDIIRAVREIPFSASQQAFLDESPPPLFIRAETAMNALNDKEITPKEFRKSILAMAPMFKSEMYEGNAKSIEAFGNILLLAYEKKLLTHKDLVTLLAGPSHESALNHALSGSRSDAVRAFGNIVLGAYHADILSGNEVCNILDCPPRDRDFSAHIDITQGEALAQANHASKAAFGDILQSFDVIRAGKVQRDRTPLSFFKPDLASRLNETKLLWLTVTDLPRVLKTLAPGDAGLSTFIHDHKNVIRKLPYAKRVEITEALVEHGSAADLKLLVGSDTRLFSPRYYADAEPPHFLAIAAKRGDTDMIKAVGDFLVTKLRLASKLSPTTKEALRAELQWAASNAAKSSPSGNLVKQYARKMRELAVRKNLVNSQFLDAISLT